MRGYNAALCLRSVGICQKLPLLNRGLQRLTDAGLRGEERYTMVKPYAATAPAATADHQASMGDQNGRGFPLFRTIIRGSKMGGTKWATCEII